MEVLNNVMVLLLFSAEIISVTYGQSWAAWSHWSMWTDCSRTCGGGISIRTRTCLQRWIVRGEAKCNGENMLHEKCNTQVCSEGPDNFRAYQCSQRNNVQVAGKYHEWLPHYDEDHPCELSCKSKIYDFAYSFGKAIDGTRCMPDLHDICINGKCKKVGCDGKIGSREGEDMCGVCYGKNATCLHVQSVFYSEDIHSPEDFFQYHEITVIPKGSTNIKVTDESNNFLALVNSKRDYVLNGGYVVGHPGIYEAGGTVFHYERSKHMKERLWARGPTKEDLYLMVLMREENPGIPYEYWLPKGEYENERKFLNIRPQRPTTSATTTSTTTTSTSATTTTTTTTPRPPQTQRTTKTTTVAVPILPNEEDNFSEQELHFYQIDLLKNTHHVEILPNVIDIPGNANHDITNTRFDKDSDNTFNKNNIDAPTEKTVLIAPGNSDQLGNRNAGSATDLNPGLLQPDYGKVLTVYDRTGDRTDYNSNGNPRQPSTDYIKEDKPENDNVKSNGITETQLVYNPVAGTYERVIVDGSTSESDTQVTDNSLNSDKINNNLPDTYSNNQPSGADNTKQNGGTTSVLTSEEDLRNYFHGGVRSPTDADTNTDDIDEVVTGSFDNGFSENALHNFVDVMAPESTIAIPTAANRPASSNVLYPVRPVGNSGGRSSQRCGGACPYVSEDFEHYCKADFVIQGTVLGIKEIGTDTRYVIKVSRTFKTMFPLEPKEFLWAANSHGQCRCPFLEKGKSYIIMATYDVMAGSESRLAFSSTSYTREYVNNALNFRHLRKQALNQCPGGSRRR